MRRTHIYLLALLFFAIGQSLNAQSIYTGKIKLGSSSGSKWYRVAKFNITSQSWNAVNIEAKVQYINSKEMYTANASIRLRSTPTSSTSTWQYESKGIDGSLLKFVKSTNYIWELWAYSSNNYGVIGSTVTSVEDKSYSISMYNVSEDVTTVSGYTELAVSGNWTFNESNIGIGSSNHSLSNLYVSNATPQFDANNANQLIIKSTRSGNPNDNRMVGLTLSFDDISNAHSSNQKSVGIFAKSASAWSNSVDMLFYTRSAITSPIYFDERMRITHNGLVGIGTSSPDSKLTVKGTIHSEEVKVEVVGADFVFATDYKLMPLTEIEAYIKQNRHLPQVPSAAAMEANGIELGKMNMLLLQKIEELTLLMIEQQKEIQKQNERIVKLEEK